MNINLTRLRAVRWDRFKGMFNLNDPRWGRGSDDGKSGAEDHREPQRPQRPQGPNQGPPDLDELWQDFNRKLSGLFGGKSGGGKSGGNFPGLQPGPKGRGIGLGVIGGALVLVWLGTGFFIVQEGQQAVITQFGRYHSTVGAGFNWRLPYPVQRHETVNATQIRSLDVGGDAVMRATGLRESAMLTEDENIVEIKFAVQYRLSDARAFLFNSRDPEDSVRKAAETAVREVVGKMRMDAALADERDQIGPRVRSLMQVILDRYQLGIEVVGINLQQGGVRPPLEVQAAFDDVLKAGQERERAKNEAEAYANEVVPRAKGAASRLLEEANGYKARIVAQAEGDAQRFRLVQAEYAKAPQVTRDRMYLEAMQQIYGNVTKVLVDSKQGSNMLYLPLDKIMQLSAQGDTGQQAAAQPSAGATESRPASGPNSASLRSRDSERSRDRDSR
jgi:modulator of FtsH protease HflK